MSMQTECTVGNLARVELDFDDALSGFITGRNDIDVICHNCSSGSFVIGESPIRKNLEGGRLGIKGTTLLAGVVAAMEALGVTSVSVDTTYTPDINALERGYLECQGIGVAAIEGLSLKTDGDMNKVSPAFLHDFGLSLDRPDTDALF